MPDRAEVDMHAKSCSAMPVSQKSNSRERLNMIGSEETKLLMQDFC